MAWATGQGFGEEEGLKPGRGQRPALRTVLWAQCEDSNPVRGWEAQAHAVQGPSQGFLRAEERGAGMRAHLWLRQQ